MDVLSGEFHEFAVVDDEKNGRILLVHQVTRRREVVSGPSIDVVALDELLYIRKHRNLFINLKILLAGLLV
jgi:predicted RNase H-like nuclease (RuvC/YqgF family)